jgi:hypothetical protein
MRLFVIFVFVIIFGSACVSIDDKSIKAVGSQENIDLSMNNRQIGNGMPVTVQGRLQENLVGFGDAPTGWAIDLDQPVTVWENEVIHSCEVDGEKMKMMRGFFRITGEIKRLRGVESPIHIILYPDKIQPVNEAGSK